MPLDESPMISFSCENCRKRLKVRQSAAGKRLKCPKCGSAVTVPSGQEKSAPKGDSAAPTAQPEPELNVAPELGPLDIGGPAIADISRRRDEAAEIRAEKEKKRQEQRRRSSSKEAPSELKPVEPGQSGSTRASDQTNAMMVPSNTTSDEGLIPFDSDDELFEQPENTPQGGSGNDRAGVSAAQEDSADAQQPSRETPRPSVFDDDLPELEQLLESGDLAATPAKNVTPSAKAGNRESTAKPKRKSSRPNGERKRKQQTTAPPQEPIPFDDQAGPLEDPLGDELDNLVPDLPGGQPLPDLYEEEVDPNAEYRIVCATCGTPQYVAPSAQGMKIKCPDCYISFTVPPPPKGWKPTKKKKKSVMSDADMPLAPAEELPHAKSDEARRERTQEMLDKARTEISEDELDRLYDHDFDTAGFVQKTFGFLSDPMTMAQVIGYGIVFFMLFLMMQFGLSNTEGYFGRGLLLLTVILTPMIGILFALPMLSGGLALIESVANKQRRVAEFPGFNVFDNAGDVILIAIALGAALVPGFFVGSILAGSLGGAGIMRVSGMMLTTFALFPIFLLSMLDNNTIFQPISGSVLRSLRAAPEAWGGYYLKTMIAFATVMVSWYVLFSLESGVATGFGGAMIPLLVFFTCQQIGSLADSISDELSFEFTPPAKEDEEENSGGDRYEIDDSV